jgi:hypothetical protein
MRVQDLVDQYHVRYDVDVRFGMRSGTHFFTNDFA